MSGTKFCSQCGNENPISSRFCQRCGGHFDPSQTVPPPRQAQPETPPTGTYAPPPAAPYQPTYDRPPKDKMVAGILALLLGGLGVHKFYLENIGAGILYLCFSWTGIPTIIGIIEGIIYLTESEEEFQRNHIFTPTV